MFSSKLSKCHFGDYNCLYILLVSKCHVAWNVRETWMWEASEVCVSLQWLRTVFRRNMTRVQKMQVYSFFHSHATLCWDTCHQWRLARRWSKSKRTSMGCESQRVHSTMLSKKKRGAYWKETSYGFAKQSGQFSCMCVQSYRAQESKRLG